MWYVLCSTAVLYDHAEISCLSSSTGCVIGSYALKIFRNQFGECSLGPPTHLWYFWDTNDARACRVFAPAALGFPSPLIPSSSTIMDETAQPFLHDRCMSFVPGYQFGLKGRGQEAAFMGEFLDRCKW